jgi:predicted Zn finger-like uncharacterized protein
VKISCPACAAKYSIADEKVHERLAKIRCRKCGTTIVIDGKAHPPHVYAADGSAAESGSAGPSAHEYSIDFGDNDQRTMSLNDIVSAYNSGQLTAETFVWTEGMSDWKPLSEVPEIVDALHAVASRPGATSSPAPPPVGGAVAAPSPWDVPQRPSDVQVARAAATKGGRGAAGDLFGSFGAAGSEHDISMGSSEGQLAAGSATGARNESSVLFSLSALTAAAKPVAAPASAGSTPYGVAASPSTTSKAKEDSGLIDLKALTSSAVKTDEVMPVPVLGGSPLGHVPMGLGSPLGGGLATAAVDTGPMPDMKQSKTGLIIAGSIVLAAVLIGVFFIMRPAPPPPPAPVATPVAAPTPTPTPEAVTAKPPATGTAEPSASVAKTPPKYRGGGRKAGASSGGAVKESGGGGAEAPAPAAAPAPKKSACGCAPGDLACAIKCSAKGG